MARRVNFSYSGDNLSLDEIDKTYNKVLLSIETKYSEDKNFYYSDEFLGYTKEEISQERDDVIGEVEKEVSLTLFASVEASLRSDFINRCQLRKRINYLNSIEVVIILRRGYIHMDCLRW